MSITALPDAETPQATRRVDQLTAHDGQSHQTLGNQVIHFIAVPLIETLVT